VIQSISSQVVRKNTVGHKKPAGPTPPKCPYMFFLLSGPVVICKETGRKGPHGIASIRTIQRTLERREAFLGRVEKVSPSLDRAIER
jgi:hypothetical protein